MFDGIWFINSAIRVNQLSVFSTEERLEQTKKTLDSIDKYCPNNMKFIFDGSPFPIENEKEIFRDRPNTVIVHTGDNPDIQQLGLIGQRSLAETLSFISFLNWFRQMKFVSKRIYKISGRYELNDNFVLNDSAYERAFVFADKEASWMPQSLQERADVYYLYKLRLWHMDSYFLDSFHENLTSIYRDCLTYGIDVEHSYYKNLHWYKTVELTKIGVQGIIGPSGDFMDD